MKGGYTLIDCGGLNLLADEAQTIAGLYERCLDAYYAGTLVVACNCTYGDDIPTSPFTAILLVDDGDVILITSIYQVTIDEDDEVTIALLAEPNPD